MFAGFVTFVFLALLAVGLAAAVWILSLQLSGAAGRPADILWLKTWIAKGVLVPWFVWCLMNMGMGWWLPPYMPQISKAMYAGKPWFALFLGAAGTGVCVLTSFWAAATLAWTLVATSIRLRDEDRAGFHGLCLTVIVALGWVAVGVCLLGGFAWAGLAALTILMPIAHFASNVFDRPKRLPSYSRAIAKMKFGKYADAEREVLSQLDQAEDDFQGWLMLASLYAEQFNDLPEAEQTILELCDQPNTNASQAAVALNRLADWHLRIGRNPVAARSALQIICSQFKNSHVARMAQIRIAQLPPSREALEAETRTGTVTLPALGDVLDQPARVDTPSLPRQKAMELANSLSNRLQRDPNDVASRERFARVLADHLDKAGEATKQLELLLELPDQAAEKRAAWLSLIAAYHLKHLSQPERARIFLERLVSEFPGTVQAMAARRRLELLSRSRRVE